MCKPNIRQCFPWFLFHDSPSPLSARVLTISYLIADFSSLFSHHLFTALVGSVSLAEQGPEHEVFNVIANFIQHIRKPIL